MDRIASPPTPSALTHLRPSNMAGGVVVAGCLAITGLALWLSSLEPRWLWAAGPVVFALVQWFAVLHECGRETLFRSKRLHGLVGQIAGFFSVIPFYNWKRIHG